MELREQGGTVLVREVKRLDSVSGQDEDEERFVCGGERLPSHS
jgi:hypothetical protein